MRQAEARLGLSRMKVFLAIMAEDPNSQYMEESPEVGDLCTPVGPTGLLWDCFLPSSC